MGSSPGAANSVYSLVAPSQLSQVDHQPQQPTAQQDVTISIRATDPDGVGAVSLAYQLVDPGQYIRLTDAAFNQWTHVPMYDDGTNGDPIPNDRLYTAVLPAALQVHRRLVRYRVHATDTAGNAVSVPSAEDPQPNFAYFVYDGVPAWTAAARPGNTDPVIDAVLRQDSIDFLIQPQDLRPRGKVTDVRSYNLIRSCGAPARTQLRRRRSPGRGRFASILALLPRRKELSATCSRATPAER